MQARRHDARAFTLIELLVVVGVISLLIGLLIPALGSARQAGQLAICQSNQRQIAMANSAYLSDNNYYIPGSATSGWEFTHVPGVYNDRREAAAELSSRRNDAAMSADDWMSPILGPFVDLPTNRSVRLRAILNQEFKCAANNARYAPGEASIYDEQNDNQAEAGFYDNPEDLYLASYSTSIFMSMAQNWDDAERKGLARRIPTTNGVFWPLPTGGYVVQNMTSDADRAVDLSTSNHVFRLDTLGSPSEKAFVYDGARYLVRRGETPYFTFRADFEAGDSLYGGNFANRSPVMNVGFARNGSPFHITGYDSETRRGEIDDFARRNVYRHPEDSLAIVRFDGSSARYTEAESRQMHLYFPRGATVVRTGGLGDPRAEAGDVIH